MKCDINECFKGIKKRVIFHFNKIKNLPLKVHIINVRSLLKEKRFSNKVKV